jgi:hypothetical protein
MEHLEALFILMNDLSKSTTVRYRILMLRSSLVKPCLTLHSGFHDHLVAFERYLIKGNENPDEMDEIKLYICKWLMYESYNSKDSNLLRMLKEVQDVLIVFQKVVMEIPLIQADNRSIFSWMSKEKDMSWLQNLRNQVNEWLIDVSDRRKKAINLLLQKNHQFVIESVCPEMLQFEKVQKIVKNLTMLHQLVRGAIFDYI